MAAAITRSHQSSVEKTSLDALVAKWSALSAGYKPIPEHGERYQELMEAMIRDDDRTKFQRQSPLVNAGYAMRVASVSNTVRNFIQFHCLERGEKRVDIVLLGCGLDIIGIWAHSLAPEQVHIWEVDTPAVASCKREKLLQQGLVLSEKENDDENNQQLILRGQIKSTKDILEKDSSSQGRNNYHLIAADLCDLDSLNTGLSQPNLLPVAAQTKESCGHPTLVLFELVLAYLGQDATNRLLEWCASHLLGRAPSRSVLVAFEALGGESTASDSIISTYQQEYGRQFQAKLQRGKVHVKKTSKDDEMNAPGTFHPLGSSCKEIQQRLLGKLHGYAHVHACSSGASAWWAAKQQPSLRLFVPPGELFDEHAALILHLSSYTLVVGFAMADTKEYFELRCRLCPWYFDPFTTKFTNKNNNELYFGTVLEPKDEVSVRTIFSSTYDSLGEQYPAVKKMVKTALKKEFSTRSDQPRMGESVIRLGYQSLGGDFLVAVQYSSGRREVVGGIGVRRWNSSSANTGPGHSESFKPTYEIHRFFVAEKHRGQGIGKTLLEMSESVVHSKVQAKTSYRIVATTLALLTGANQLYSQCGYGVLEETSIGDLKMKTFVKAFPEKY